MELAQEFKTKYPLYCKKVIRSQELTRMEKYVYTFLGTYGDWCNIKQIDLAKDMGINVRTLQKAIRVLVYVGLLVREYSFYKRVRYKIVSLKDQIKIMDMPLGVKSLLGFMKDRAQRVFRREKYSKSTKFDKVKNKKNVVKTNDTATQPQVSQVETLIKEDLFSKLEKSNVLSERSAIDRLPLEKRREYWINQSKIHNSI